MGDIGTVALQQIRKDGTDDLAFRIVSADPRIRIGHELLAAVYAAGGDYADEYSRITLDGGVLTISDDYGARFIYRINWDDYADGGYLAEWPD